MSGSKGGDDSAGEAIVAHPEVLALTAASNPYLDFYRAFCTTRQQELIDVFDPAIKKKTRAELYAALDVSIAMKYSWAIPDERALRIIKHYGPIVEMGAGNGYWGKLLQLRGVDIICYDLHVAGEDEEQQKSGNEEEQGSDDEQQLAEDESDEEGNGSDGGDNESEGDHEESRNDEDEATKDAHSEDGGNEDRKGDGGDDNDDDGNDDDEDFSEEDEDEEVEVEQIYWTNVLKGMPKDLRKHSDRTLFLCYPDDFEDSEESMALESLCNYSGDTVIHVGELFGQSICRPGAWGRTSAKEFQEHLASVYHKVLQTFNWVVKQGYADKDRIAIYGGSYGGYAVLAGLAFTPDVYACGVDIVGPSHAKTLLQSIPPYWEPMRKMLQLRVGDVENDQALNERISPLYHADKITKPLLIAQGKNDPRVKQAESDQIAKKLYENKHDVKYVLYTDEGHGFARPANKLEFTSRVEDFFAQYLGGRKLPLDQSLVEGNSAVEIDVSAL